MIRFKFLKEIHQILNKHSALLKALIVVVISEIILQIMTLMVRHLLLEQYKGIMVSNLNSKIPLSKEKPQLL
jgi:hypothetical protein